MNLRSGVAPVMASGTANAVKLLVATLAFAGAYLGLGAGYDASVQAPAGTAAGTEAGTAADVVEGAPVRIVVLSSRALPATTEQRPAAGTVTVGPIEALGPCDRPYRAQAVVGNDDPRATVSYGWRLERWSPGSRSWRAYLGTSAGFTGESQLVDWQPRIVNNPGWYRVVLSVSGEAPLRSERFLVSC